MQQRVLGRRPRGPLLLLRLLLSHQLRPRLLLWYRLRPPCMRLLLSRIRLHACGNRCHSGCGDRHTRGHRHACEEGPCLWQRSEGCVCAQRVCVWAAGVTMRDTHLVAVVAAHVAFGTFHSPRPTAGIRLPLARVRDGTVELPPRSRASASRAAIAAATMAGRISRSGNDERTA